MAAYNRWANQLLYRVCAELSDIQRKHDSGVFFDSIHGTLNHLLLGDSLWLSRFTGTPFVVSGLDQELFADFVDLRKGRVETDQAIIDWAMTMDDEALDSVLEYTSLSNPQVRCIPMWTATTHFFNHQTHHRGQVTAMLSQLGHDYGALDFLFLPDLYTLEN